MSSQHRTSSRKLKGLKISSVTLASALFLTGCSDQAKVGWLPTHRGVTDNADLIMDLWIGSWVAALIVGLITWGLMLWCFIAYRRRKNEIGYPRQLAYHAPLEIFYTIAPIILIVSLFSFSDTAERAITAPKADQADVTVEVYGKQWAWDFNYLDENVYSSGVQARLDKQGDEGVEETLPTLYLPVNSTVDLQLKTRDVIHSFWVPAFLEKRDTIPGQTNHMYFTTHEEGFYAGKCAELCGEYHSEMLFNVAVVSQEEYDQQMKALADEGNTGRLGEEFNRNPNLNVMDK
ncbi:cytochrome c oxidase subunit II [Rothia terrae]|uniref:cytochrome-c oxidase n=1 Tax=Rothia terrae TaxID=396015 RepID=A0A7H2BB41_9MICC|nr:cytochrome c oxidase subunit II [Rothia terrae]NKZ33471.1 cytochrome c oxidase subunit II [Rothia terrae]QNV36887.1 cytochrome c oxidase subunit II [Rothia terrae]